VAILMLALQAPTLQELVSLRTELPCGASCCHSKKSCSCCRHSREQRVPQGAQWSSGKSCPKDCGQFAELPTQPGVVTSEIPHLAAPDIHSAPLKGRSLSDRSRCIVEAALFQRPPPVLL